MGVSLSGTSSLIVQLGDSGGIETSGYAGATSVAASASVPTVVNHSSGFELFSNNAGSIFQGSLDLMLGDASTFTWGAKGDYGYSSSAVFGTVAGSKSLSAALDRIRITSVGGTDTFDLGKISVSYE